MFLIHCFDQMDQNLLPNLFLDSRRHTIMTKNVFLEIHADGHILFSERLTMKLKCPMHLRYYPFDLQICPIRIESYAFRDSQVSFKGSSYPSHFMFEINVGKSRIRQRKTLNYNEIIINRF